MERVATTKQHNLQPNVEQHKPTPVGEANVRHHGHTTAAEAKPRYLLPPSRHGALHVRQRTATLRAHSDAVASQGLRFALIITTCGHRSAHTAAEATTLSLITYPMQHPHSFPDVVCHETVGGVKDAFLVLVRL